jgi:type I restriction enzyme R subunit
MPCHENLTAADVDDELELVIVKDMMHTLYLDRPLKGALLMQTLARVNRTFRGKEDGLLVAYAPLADNLSKALAEYTVRDQAEKPVGRDTSEAAALTVELVDRLRELLAGYDWRAVLNAGGAKAYINAATGATNHLRAVGLANDPSLGAETLAARYRKFSSQLARAWALASGRDSLPELRPEIAFYEEVRVWMAKFDARERQARGEPVPEEVQRLLAALIDSATDAQEVIDIYEAAGMPQASLADLTPGFVQNVQNAPNPQLAIEALRAMLLEESATAARNNVVRQRAFSERIGELMAKYTNQQLTSAEVIAELVKLAQEVSAEASRGSRFAPPLNDDELAFYDAVAQNESAVEVQGEGVLAQIARDLVEVMRRDVRTDWTVRDDVRAKLRASIKRLLVKNGYPPDKQPAAIALVMDQMETMAPRYAEERE